MLRSTACPTRLGPPWHTERMVGGIIIAVVVIVVLPVATLMSGALAAAGLGWLLCADNEIHNPDHPFLDLHR